MSSSCTPGHYNYTHTYMLHKHNSHMGCSHGRVAGLIGLTQNETVMIVTPAVTCGSGHKLRARSLLSVNIDTKHAPHFASAELPDCQTSGGWQEACYLCCTVYM